jgi:hypothetical protein
MDYPAWRAVQPNHLFAAIDNIMLRRLNNDWFSKHFPGMLFTNIQGLCKETWKKCFFWIL